MKNILVVITTAFVPTGGLTTVMMNYYHLYNNEAETLTANPAH